MVGGCGGKLTSNYNIISFDSDIDEPPGSKLTSHKELGYYLGAIDFTVKRFPCVFSRLRGLETSALDPAVHGGSRRRSLKSPTRIKGHKPVRFTRAPSSI